MNAAMPNAYSFTVRGLIAAAAAARSVDRSAGSRAPRARRRDPAEHRRRHVAVNALEPGIGTEVEAEELGLGHRGAGRAAAPGGGGEPEVLDGARAGQGGDGERHTADPDRGDRGDDPDDDRDRDADDRAGGEGDAEVDGHVADRE